MLLLLPLVAGTRVPVRLRMDLGVGGDEEGRRRGLALPFPRRSPMRLVPLLVLAACTAGKPDDGPTAGGDDTGGPAAPVESCGYTAAEDLDPGEDVVEVDLRASAHAWDPGTGVPLETGLAFNEQVPGPLLAATRGDTLRVNFTNDTDADLTIHWHGLRAAPEMDGVMQMMDPVAPGETFTYELALQDSGAYWYHPHMSGDTVLERGLYGAILVREPGEGRADFELPLVLDDVLLDADGQIEPQGTEEERTMGRLGSVLLANGASGRRIEVTQGQTMLLRLVNASNARIWDLRLEGHTFTVVATDGGFLAEPYEVENLVLVPGERYVVLVEATGEPGAEYRRLNARVPLHEAGEHHGGGKMETDPLGEGENPVLSFVYAKGSVTRTPWVQPTADVPGWDGATATFGHQWVLEENAMDGSVTIDGEAWPEVTPAIVAGNVETTFEVVDETMMHHPFHLHGNRFQIVAVEGVAPSAPPGWKDTRDAPPMSTLTVVSALDIPGEWMAHCHILEHAEDGMAALLTVQA
ncbi:MAG: multicopper oxidase family protein [Myxococcota bacterium]